jgi:hypothetical protein
MAMEAGVTSWHDDPEVSQGSACVVADRSTSELIPPRVLHGRPGSLSSSDIKSNRSLQRRTCALSLFIRASDKNKMSSFTFPLRSRSDRTAAGEFAPEQFHAQTNIAPVNQFP